MGFGSVTLLSRRAVYGFPTITHFLQFASFEAEFSAALKKRKRSPEGTCVLDLLKKKLRYDDDDDDTSLDVDGSDGVIRKFKLVSAKAFKAGSRVYLGMLRKPSDLSYNKKQSGFSFSVGANAKIATTLKVDDPNSWREFMMLFFRLIQGYSSFHSEKSEALLKYLETLSQFVDLKAASPEAVIDYDRRIRSSHPSSWDWLIFDQALFVCSQAAFPLTASEKGQTSKNQNRNSPASHSVEARTKRGVCHDWKDSKTCYFEKTSKGCRFSHWCTNEKCVAAKKTDHKPDSGKCV